MTALAAQTRRKLSLLTLAEESPRTSNSLQFIVPDRRPACLTPAPQRSRATDIFNLPERFHARRPVEPLS